MKKCVVRQPIKDAHEQIVGYELMFQYDDEGLYNNTEMEAANTIADFLLQNNDKIFNEKLTFITFTPSLLFRNTPKIFDKDKIVIQIEDNLIVHPLSSVLIKKYRDESYKFAVNDFQFSPRYFGMLENVDYVKINMLADREESSLKNMVDMMHSFGKLCIGTGVNSAREYDLAKRVGVDYLEGSHIAESVLTRSSKLDYLQGNFFQLVVEVVKDETDLDEIERIISRDASLTYGILKMANSAYFASKKKITSIRQAIVTVGTAQLKQWVYLLSLKEGSSGSEEVLKRSFLRATFSAALVEHCPGFPLSKAEAYLLGMFSTLEYMIDAPMEETLEELPIAEEVKAALTVQEGPGGTLYKLLLDYENADWKSIRQHSDELGISMNGMAQIYIDSVEKVNNIWDELVGMMQEESEEENEGESAENQAEENAFSAE